MSPLIRTPAIGFRAHPDLVQVLLNKLMSAKACFQTRSLSEILGRSELGGNDVQPSPTSVHEKWALVVYRCRASGYLSPQHHCAKPRWSTLYVIICLYARLPQTLTSRRRETACRLLLYHRGWLGKKLILPAGTRTHFRDATGLV